MVQEYVNRQKEYAQTLTRLGKAQAILRKKVIDNRRGYETQQQRLEDIWKPISTPLKNIMSGLVREKKDASGNSILDTFGNKIFEPILTPDLIRNAVKDEMKKSVPSGGTKKTVDIVHDLTSETGSSTVVPLSSISGYAHPSTRNLRELIDIATKKGTTQRMWDPDSPYWNTYLSDLASSDNDIQQIRATVDYMNYSFLDSSEYSDTRSTTSGSTRTEDNIFNPQVEFNESLYLELARNVQNVSRFIESTRDVIIEEITEVTGEDPSAIENLGTLEVVQIAQRTLPTNKKLTPDMINYIRQFIDIMLTKFETLKKEQDQPTLFEEINLTVLGLAQNKPLQLEGPSSSDISFATPSGTFEQESEDIPTIEEVIPFKDAITKARTKILETANKEITYDKDDELFTQTNTRITELVRSDSKLSIENIKRVSELDPISKFILLNIYKDNDPDNRLFYEEVFDIYKKVFNIEINEELSNLIEGSEKPDENKMFKDIMDSEVTVPYIYSFVSDNPEIPEKLEPKIQKPKVPLPEPEPRVDVPTPIFKKVKGGPNFRNALVDAHVLPYIKRIHATISEVYKRNIDNSVRAPKSLKTYINGISTVKGMSLVHKSMHHKFHNDFFNNFIKPGDSTNNFYDTYLISLDKTFLNTLFYDIMNNELFMDEDNRKYINRSKVDGVVKEYLTPAEEYMRSLTDEHIASLQSFTAPTASSVAKEADKKKEKGKEKGSSKKETTGSGMKTMTVDKNGMFGNLKIDMVMLSKPPYQLKARNRNGNLLLNRKADPDLYNLLTKHYIPNKKYSEISKKLFSDLIKLSGLSITGHPKEKLIESTPSVQIFKNATEALDRLELILGSKTAGNTSKQMYNEGIAILDFLMKSDKIKPAEYKALYEGYFNK